MISPGPPSPTPSFILKNFTIDDTNASLKYSQGWNQSVSSNGGSFHSSDGVGVGVTFNLPANAVAIYYFGFQQSSGALYQTCLDCNAEDAGEGDVINAQNEARSSEPMLLYEKTNLDPSVSHSFALLNLPDSRFANTSTITLDAFIVTVQGQAASSASASPSTSLDIAPSFIVQESTGSPQPVPTVPPVEPPILPPAASSTTGNPDATSTTATSSPSSSSQVSHAQSNLSSGERLAEQLRSPLLLTAVIAAALFIVCTTTYALLYFLRRRRRRRKAPYIQIGESTAIFFGGKGGGGNYGGSGKENRRGEVNNGESDNGVTVKVAKNAMIEQLVPDRPRLNTSYASMPPPSPPAMQQAAYRTASASLTYSVPRTAPRSLFPLTVPPLYPSVRYPSLTPARPPGLQRLPSWTGSRDPSAAAARAMWTQMATFMPPNPVSSTIPPDLVKAVRFANAERTGWGVDPSQHKHPYISRFVVAEVETREKGHARTQPPSLGQWGSERGDSGV